MSSEPKNEKVRFFRSEEAFCRYLDSLTHRRGYILVETSPLFKSSSSLFCRRTIFSGQPERMKG